MKNPIPFRVKEENIKFFNTTQFAYYFGLTHSLAILGFYLLGVYELMLFNIFISVPSFIVALVVNRLGKHNLAFTIAFLELFIHQTLAVFFLGWQSGFQYWYIYLIGLSFFNPKWKFTFQFSLLILIAVAFVATYTYCSIGIYPMPLSLVKPIFISNGITSALVLVLLINTYSKSTYLAEENLKKANAILSDKNLEIKFQHEQIVQSIHYAEKIQRAVISNLTVLDKHFKEYFVIFKPKDIVSGDFYWFTEIEDKVIVVCADCTGHGVPGGFMSMLGLSFLNEIVNQQRTVQPKDILDKLRIQIKKSLNQQSENQEQKDGMDIAVCVFNKDLRSMTYAGAHNSIFIISKGILTEYAATKNPIGVYIKEIPFEQQTIQLAKGDKVYLLTDGFIDQFGGNPTRKFMRKQLKESLLTNHALSMQEQKDVIENVFHHWKIGQKQTDDCTLIGLLV